MIEPKQSQGREMLRVDAVRVEMASAVRLLGQGGASAKEEATIAARRTKLSVRLIERLRYQKIIRVAADVADTIREAIAAQQLKQEAHARHEIAILSARLEILEKWADATEPNVGVGEPLPSLQSLRRNGSLAGPGTATKGAGDKP